MTTRQWHYDVPVTDKLESVTEPARGWMAWKAWAVLETLHLGWCRKFPNPAFALVRHWSLGPRRFYFAEFAGPPRLFIRPLPLRRPTVLMYQVNSLFSGSAPHASRALFPTSLARGSYTPQLVRYLASSPNSSYPRFKRGNLPDSFPFEWKGRLGRLQSCANRRPRTAFVQGILTKPTLH
jgi:hypothetical protein